jgi:predicted transcriptional regulator
MTTAPFVQGCDTSKAAAESIEPSVPTLQACVMACFVAAGDDGATCDEVEQETGLRHQTASARVRELALAALIHDSGRRRKTSSGRSARVYVAGPDPREGAALALLDGAGKGEP